MVELPLVRGRPTPGAARRWRLGRRRPDRPGSDRRGTLRV